MLALSIVFLESLLQKNMAYQNNYRFPMFCIAFIIVTILSCSFFYVIPWKRLTCFEDTVEV